MFRFHELPLTTFEKSAIRTGYERVHRGFGPGDGRTIVFAARFLRYLRHATDDAGAQSYTRKLCGEGRGLVRLDGVRRALGLSFAVAAFALLAGGSAVTAGAATPTASYSQDVLAASPVSYWRLGETSGTSAADEAGTNPGTYNNVLLDQPGALTCDSNPSASFSGAQSYARVPASASLDMTSAVTVEFWAKRRTISSTYQVLVGKPGDGASKFENYAVWLAPSGRYT